MGFEKKSYLLMPFVFLEHEEFEDLHHEAAQPLAPVLWFNLPPKLENLESKESNNNKKSCKSFCFLNFLLFYNYFTLKYIF